MDGRRFTCAAVALVGLSIAGCGHEARPYDVARLEQKCGIEVGRELTPTELTCLARVAGLRATKKCPLDISGGTFGETATPVWFVREGCGDVGIVVTRIGAIVGVELGDAVTPPPESRDAPAGSPDVPVPVGRSGLGSPIPKFGCRVDAKAIPRRRGNPSPDDAS